MIKTVDNSRNRIKTINKTYKLEPHSRHLYSNFTWLHSPVRNIFCTLHSLSTCSEQGSDKVVYNGKREKTHSTASHNTQIVTIKFLAAFNSK